MKASLYREFVSLERPVRASAQLHADRSRLFLRIEEDGVGFGEVAPQPIELFGDPGVDEVIEATREVLSRVVEFQAREGVLPSWSMVSSLAGDTSERRAAGALIEMALLDRELRRNVMSIGEFWLPRAHTPRQSTVSALDDREWVYHSLDSRLRVKTSSGEVSERALEQLSALRVPVLLDFNCSARSIDEVLKQVDVIGEVATIDAVEQPFGIGNVADHARLAARLDVALCLDESVRSIRDLTRIVRYEAASMICVKPARVGGLANARSIISRGQQLGFRVYVGGFFESPYARRVLRALAYGCDVTEPSDLGVVALEDASGEISSVTASFGVEPAASMLDAAEALTLR
ncbi:MAG: enolase C-terminal domain-like protein [Acidimicrobiales bacterium]